MIIATIRLVKRFPHATQHAVVLRLDFLTFAGQMTSFGFVFFLHRAESGVQNSVYVRDGRFRINWPETVCSLLVSVAPCRRGAACASDFDNWPRSF
jgi:hypothetical protein